jgi:hypothetical protein
MAVRSRNWLAAKHGASNRIALAALAISFAGLFVFGIGFLFTSVWYWQVAGFSFATVFTQSFGLTGGESGTR